MWSFGFFLTIMICCNYLVDIFRKIVEVIVEVQVKVNKLQVRYYQVCIRHNTPCQFIGYFNRNGVILFAYNYAVVFKVLQGFGEYFN